MENELKVNLLFLYEGEEESDSEGFEQAIKNHLDWFKHCSLILIANTYWIGENHPCLTYGLFFYFY